MISLNKEKVHPVIFVVRDQPFFELSIYILHTPGKYVSEDVWENVKLSLNFLETSRETIYDSIKRR